MRISCHVMAEVKIEEPGFKTTQLAKEAKQPQKKKKKNAPDKPQPAWLFPPDAENPVLNPKIKTEAEERGEYEDRMGAIKFLKHKAVSAPLKTAPPTQLLTLIGAFLASYGFISTGRIFSLERNARKKLDGWDDHIGKKLPKGTPDLVKIYKDWSKDYYEGSGSEDEDDNEESKVVRVARQSHKLQESQLNATEETSSSGSEESSSDEEGATIKSKNGAKQNSVKKGKAGRNSSRSSSTSTSDSDADDEKRVAAKPSTTKPTVAGMVNKLKRKAAPGGSSSTVSSTDSDSDLGSSSPNEPAKKKKKSESAQNPKKSVSRSNTVDAKAANGKTTTKSSKADTESATANVKPSKAKIEPLKSEPVPEQSAKEPTEAISEKETVKTASSSNSSSDSSKKSSLSSDSNASASHSSKTTKKTPTIPAASGPAAEQLTNGRKDSTDSSTTLNGTSTKRPTATKPVSSSSPSDTSSSSDHGVPLSEPATTTTTKRKRSPSPKATTPPPKPPAKRPKKPSTPFSRIPQDTKVDPKLASNAYVPYDYAEQAHQDLSVTNGKGYKKEKNKKKKGA